MSCEIERWKSFEVNKGDFAYCEILQIPFCSDLLSRHAPPAARCQKLAEPLAIYSAA